MPRVSLRAYARHRGCRLYSVQKAITAGRISKGEDGLIDVEAADASWAAHTDQAKQRKEPPAAPPPADPPILTGEVITAPPTLGRRPQFFGPDWPEAAPAGPPAEVEKGQVVDGASFMAARTRLAWAEVELREAMVAEKRGLAINGELARKTFREIGRMVSVGRRTLASEIAAQLVGLTDPNDIERRIRKALEAADERVAHEVLTKYADVVTGNVERSGTGS
jgi:hypothetical protein